MRQNNWLYYAVVGLLTLCLFGYVYNHGIEDKKAPKNHVIVSNQEQSYISLSKESKIHERKKLKEKEFSKFILERKYYDAYLFAAENEYISEDFNALKNYAYALYLANEKRTDYDLLAYINSIPPNYKGYLAKDIRKFALKHTTLQKWQESYSVGQKLQDNS